MRAIQSAIAMLAIAASAGCASNSPAASSASGPARWSGSFRQPQMAATAVVGSSNPGARAAAYGTITLVPLETTPPTTRVEVSISAPVSPGTQVGWALFPGPCGSPSPPLTGPNQFPTIEVQNSGNGTVRGVMSIALDARSSYHANVYWSSQVSDVSNVMMCANVTLSR